MKKDHLILAAAVLFLGIGAVHSQQAQSPKPVLDSVQAMKAVNADIIDKQKKTLDNLDEMIKTAEQIKIMGKRS